MSCKPLQCARFVRYWFAGAGKSGAGVCGAQSAPALPPKRTMLVLACLLAAAAAAPATYDQRQDGEFNVRADVQNVVFVVALPSKMLSPFSGLFKNVKPNHSNEIQERADIRVMEAFVEPSEPYHVEIGESGRTAEGDGRTVEVVIAGRRRLEADAQADSDEDEYKLLGATEQCGPDRERDPVTLTCRARINPPPPATSQENDLQQESAEASQPQPEEPTQPPASSPDAVPVSS